LSTIKENDTILVEKVDDFYDNVFSDIFEEFSNVTKESVVVYSVMQNWHLNQLKTKLYSLISN